MESVRNQHNPFPTSAILVHDHQQAYHCIAKGLLCAPPSLAEKRVRRMTFCSVRTFNTSSPTPLSNKLTPKRWIHPSWNKALSVSHKSQLHVVGVKGHHYAHAHCSQRAGFSCSVARCMGNQKLELEIRIGIGNEKWEIGMAPIGHRMKHSFS